MKNRIIYIFVSITILIVFVPGCGSFARWMTPPMIPFKLLSDASSVFEHEEEIRTLSDPLIEDTESREFRVENLSLDKFVALLNKEFPKYTVINALQANEQNEPLQVVSGLYSGTLDEVLSDFAIQYGYYIEFNDSKRYIVRSKIDLEYLDVSEVVETELSEESLSKLAGAYDVQTLLNGSKLLLTGKYNAVKRLRQALTLIEENKQSYLAKLVFARLRESDLLRIQAELEVHDFDLIAKKYDFLAAFSADLDINTNDQKTYDYTIQTIYCTDGSEATVKIGTELNRELSSMSEMGVSSVTGYNKFNDGIEFNIKPKRLTGACVDLECKFTKSKFNSTSDLSKSQVDLEYTSIRLLHSKPYYLTSYDEGSRSFSNVFIGGQKSSSREITSVWLMLIPVK